MEDIDRQEEIKIRNKEKKAKLALTMTRSNLQESNMPHSSSVATLPPVLDVTDMAGTASVLPPLNKMPLAQYATTTRAKDKPGVRQKQTALQSMTSADIRAKAEKELQQSASFGKPSKEKGRLKPLRKLRNKRYERKEDKSSHTELIRYLEDSKTEDQDKYYYCLKGRSFYEFYACHFEDIETEIDDYITISARGVTHFINKEAEFLTLSEWKDEVENYQKINKISFFKNFRIGKSFTLWKRLVKRTKMIERGSYLTKELFQADGQINRPLISIRQLLNTLQSSDILQVTS